MWTLTYSIAGDRHLLVVPEAWLAWLRPLVQAGHRYRQAVAEVAALNAQLLTLWRRQQKGSGRLRAYRARVRSRP